MKLRCCQSAIQNASSLAAKAHPLNQRLRKYIIFNNLVGWSGGGGSEIDKFRSVFETVQIILARNTSNKSYLLRNLPASAKLVPLTGPTANLTARKVQR